MRERIQKLLLEWSDEKSRLVLEDMFLRVNKEEFEEWKENEGDTSNDDINEFEFFLESMKGIIIEDGIIFFYKLVDDVEHLIGNNMVGLFHFTSSSLQKSITAGGLMTGRKKTNSYKNSHSGVYLTTQSSGNEIDFYKRHAVQKWGGDPIRVVVKMYLSELSPDPDDMDIKSGETQFISGNISPDRIIEINHEYL